MYTQKLNWKNSSRNETNKMLKRTTLCFDTHINSRKKFVYFIISVLITYASISIDVRQIFPFNEKKRTTNSISVYTLTRETQIE